MPYYSASLYTPKNNTKVTFWQSLYPTFSLRQTPCEHHLSCRSLMIIIIVTSYYSLHLVLYSSNPVKNLRITTYGKLIRCILIWFAPVTHSERLFWPESSTSGKFPDSGAEGRGDDVNVHVFVVWWEILMRIAKVHWQKSWGGMNGWSPPLLMITVSVSRELEQLLEPSGRSDAKNTLIIIIIIVIFRMITFVTRYSLVQLAILVKSASAADLQLKSSWIFSLSSLSPLFSTCVRKLPAYLPLTILLQLSFFSFSHVWSLHHHILKNWMNWRRSRKVPRELKERMIHRDSTAEYKEKEDEGELENQLRLGVSSGGSKSFAQVYQQKREREREQHS